MGLRTAVLLNELLAGSLKRNEANNVKRMIPILRNTRNMGTITKTQKRSLKEELLPKAKSLGDYVPLYVALGMISLSLSLGLYTAKQELLHGPDVRVKKSRRETLPEVIEPETVAHEAEDFIKKSLFRKVAHIQEFETPIPNPIRGDRLSKEPKVESLKTVGVEVGSLGR